MPFESRHFRLEELADGVHAAIARRDGFALCNAGIVDLGGLTLVFDAMLTPQAGAELGKAAERLTGRPADLLVDSHYHGDHVRGNGAVGAARIVSSERVRELVIERARAHLAADRAEAPGELERLRAGALGKSPDDREIYDGWMRGILATPPDLEIPAPEVTFASEMIVHGRRRSARVLTFGGGHSPSDVFVFLPDARIVLLGDLLSIGHHPSLSDGDPEAFVTILGKIRALGPDRALPGHGPVGEASDLGQMERYITVLARQAREDREEGLDQDAATLRPPPSPFESWLFSSIYEQNVRFLFDRATVTPEPAPRRGAPSRGRTRSTAPRPIR